VTGERPSELEIMAAMFQGTGVEFTDDYRQFKAGRLP
jgi:hypothetical protein